MRLCRSHVHDLCTQYKRTMSLSFSFSCACFWTPAHGRQDLHLSLRRKKTSSPSCAAANTSSHDLTQRRHRQLSPAKVYLFLYSPPEAASPTTSRGVVACSQRSRSAALPERYSSASPSSMHGYVQASEHPFTLDKFLLRVRIRRSQWGARPWEVLRRPMLHIRSGMLRHTFVHRHYGRRRRQEVQVTY